jgi:D-amino peptidase
MKIYIIQDLEGVAGVFDWAYDLKREGRLTDACAWMTEEINAAVSGALAAGADEVFVHEAHAFNFDRLHPEMKLVRSEKLEIDSSFSALFFVGQHAMAGAENGILNHSGSSRSIVNILLNDRPVGELGLIAAYAAEEGVTTALVCGDDAVCREAETLLGSCETVPVKWGTGQHTGTSLSTRQSCKEIHSGAERALARLKDFKLLELTPPYQLEIEYIRTDVADECSIIPGISLLDSRTTLCTAQSMKEVYNYYLCQGLVLRRVDAY